MRNPWIVASLAVLPLVGCSDQIHLAPASSSLDGREGLFATGSEDEQELAEDLAYDWLDQNEDRVLHGIVDLRTRGVQIREGAAHVRIDQEIDGVPVFGAQAIVHLAADGEVVDLTDNWQHGVDVAELEPAVDDVDAVERAVASSGGWDTVSSFPDLDLGIHRGDAGDRLAWRVRIPRLDGSDHPSIPVLFLDAEDGRVLERYDDLQTATCTANTAYNGSISFPCDSSGSGTKTTDASHRAGTYSIRNQEPWSITASALSEVTNSSTSWTSNHTAVDAQFGILATLDYYRNVHGRNGMDGNGGPRLKDSNLTAVVNYGTRYENAYWDGTAMVFGDGDGSWLGPTTALDIAAHELTHGVTEHTAGLVYQNQSGALNEAVSDIFAALVEQHVNGSSSNVWKVGEDAYTPGQSGDALRYMNDPAADGQSADHWTRRFTGAEDNGGVHLNSGIPNLAFKLLSDGGRHPRVASVVQVPGLGIETAGRIWYKALTEYMTPSTDFLGARTATVSAATALYGAGSPEVFAVGASWAEVGIGSVPTGGSQPTTPTTPTTPSQPGGLELTGLSAATGSALTYSVNVPAGATDLVIRMGGGTGDADLYVKAGSAPTDSAYDCRPYRSGNEEVCEFAAPAAGSWNVKLQAYAAFSGVSLSVSWKTASAPTTPSTGTLYDRTGLSGATGSNTAGTFTVPPGVRRLTVTMAGGTGDADLFVRAGAAPTATAFDCRPYASGNDEVCTFDAPAAGTWHLNVNAYAAFSGVGLRAVAE